MKVLILDGLNDLNLLTLKNLHSFYSIPMKLFVNRYTILTQTTFGER